MLKKILIGFIAFIIGLIILAFIGFKVALHYEKQEAKEYLFQERYKHCRWQGHSDESCLEFAERMQEIDENPIRVVGSNFN
ncbi:MAG: hypothetical protein Q4B79_05070 [Moraxella sp.]|uniref:hypothetical protein n=1 Tax=Moraxella sp. TaxID=479 RepID=UPI0026DA9755|nr:hypothetical protein [Moraxella sp.]MDO4450314.1 hypothetical protein [Moraxella sp.]MDO5050894.1 hypothetical protein [Moraxella equi]